MARAIDTSKPLSEDDRKYLIDRCMWTKLAEADEVAASEAARTAAENAEVTQINHPETPVAGNAATTPQDTGAPVEDDDRPYEEWSYPELQAELKARRQEAVDGGMSEADAREKYSAGGSTEDLVRRLYEDDEANPES